MSPRPSSLPERALDWLAAPDAILPLDRPADSLGLAVSTALGLLGAASWLALVGVGFASARSGGDTAWWNLPLVPPLAALLTFPPLYLVTALQGRPSDSLTLAAVAVSGPTVAGAWLGAASPVLLLYLLTGEVDAAFFLLAAVVLVVAVAAGASAAVRNASRGGPGAPGVLTTLVHYALTGWTVLVLAFHLT